MIVLYVSEAALFKVYQVYYEYIADLSGSASAHVRGRNKLLLFVPATYIYKHIPGT